jgi:DNA replication protein DnaC
MWIEKAYSLAITGPTGMGKTYIAEAIGLKACLLGYTVMNVRYRSVLDQIASARGTGLQC